MSIRSNSCVNSCALGRGLSPRITSGGAQLTSRLVHALLGGTHHVLTLDKAAGILPRTDVTEHDVVL